MFKIAICDDEAAICEQLESILQRIGSEFLKDLEWDVFFSGESLYDYLKKDKYYDIIFLDIELKEMNGVEVGHIIRDTMANETTQIVYISGNKTYAMELFKLRPLHFIIKPFDYGEIKEIIKVVLKIHQRDYRMFQYKVGPKTHSISTRDIIFFESRNRKVEVHTTEGNHVFYGKIKDICKELQRYKFIQIHKTYLVNYHYITKFEYDKVTLSNKVTLPISQANRKRIRRFYLELEGESIWD